MVVCGQLALSNRGRRRCARQGGTPSLDRRRVDGLAGMLGCLPYCTGVLFPSVAPELPCEPTPRHRSMRSSSGSWASRRSPAASSTTPSSRRATPSTAPFPGWLDPRIRAALRAARHRALYTHQAEALARVRAGRDVCVVTPTASGKSLCYELPVLQALADDPSARALWLFPTKALGEDQVAGFRAARRGSRPVDRDRRPTTATRRRRSARRSGPPARSWSPTRTCSTRRSSPTTPSGSSSSSSSGSSSSTSCTRTAGCSAATSPTCSGGCCGICRHYGSNPVIVTCSATIANPGELATALTGRAPAGRRPQRRAGRRAAPALRGPAGHRRAVGRARLAR